MDFLQQFLNYRLIWFVVGFIFLILEFMLPGIIVVFFGIGAWVVCLLLFFVDIPLNYQLSVFILTSVLSLIILRKYVRERFFGFDTVQRKDDNLIDEFIGRKAVTETDVSPQKPGKVIFRGTTWNAESDTEIKEGVHVEIIDNDSITLKIKPLDS